VRKLKEFFSEHEEDIFALLEEFCEVTNEI